MTVAKEAPTSRNRSLFCNRPQFLFVSAIVGYLSRGDGSRPEQACRTMLAKLTPFGPHSQVERSHGDASFGLALHRVLPEDDFDKQPLISSDGRYLLAADARIDNRGELADKLEIKPSVSARMSDAALLLNAWERWQLGSLDHLLGDLAFAVWDVGDKRLTLVRSPVALKPLFYHSGSNFVAFASMPQGLHGLPEISKILNFEQAAAITARLPYLGTSTIFEGISLVRHGQAVEFAGGRQTIRPLWDLESITPGSTKTSDCGEALRAELERSVKAQLRRRDGQVACQLSSGRDSSAVTTTAALALRDTGERLIALTGAPRVGFSGAAIGNRLADESVLAAKTASFHPNITHVVCRSRDRNLGQELRRLSESHFGSLTNTVALHWAAQVDEEASARGAAIMLMGSTGNLSISASGLSHFVDVLRKKGPPSWWRHARRIGGLSSSIWRTIGSVSFGPFIPEPMYKAILEASGRDTNVLFDVPVLRQPYRNHAESILRDQFVDLRPPGSYHQFRRDMLLRRDNAEKMSLALSGLDVRDPSGDRRLVELCLSFSPEQIVSPRSDPSPVYEYAFADRIPREVLHNQSRGYQAADWYELFRKEEVGQLFNLYRSNPTVDALFDFAYIDRLVKSWPTRGTGDRSVLQVYRNQLLNALALADFIDFHFPN